MKKNVNVTLWFLMSILLILVSVSVYYKRQNEKTVSSYDPNLANLKNEVKELVNSEEFQKLSEEEKRKKTFELLDKLPPEYNRLKRQFEIALSPSPEIKIIGRVIDQHGDPVIDASVWYQGTGEFLSGGGRGLAKTDEQGYFEINVRGASLSLGAITHPGIEYSYQSDGIIIYDQLKLEKSFLPYVDKQGEYDTWINYTEKKHPFIINAWRLGKYEGATRGQIIADFDASGKEYTLYLDQHDYRKQIKKGKHEDGHLYISCTRPHMKNDSDYSDWSLSIIPVNGGIQETSDVFLNEAPATGYQSSLSISERKGTNDYAHQLLSQRYFIALTNDKVYGSLFMHITPFGDFNRDACRIEIFYKTNKIGSRNLELKPRIQ